VDHLQTTMVLCFHSPSTQINNNNKMLEFFISIIYNKVWFLFIWDSTQPGLCVYSSRRSFYVHLYTFDLISFKDYYIPSFCFVLRYNRLKEQLRKQPKMFLYFQTEVILINSITMSYNNAICLFQYFLLLDHISWTFDYVS
jgi:hypothetical protein